MARTLQHRVLKSITFTDAACEPATWAVFHGLQCLPGTRKGLCCLDTTVNLILLMQGAHAPSTSGAPEPVEGGEQTEDVQLTDGQGQPVTYTAEQIKALNRDGVRHTNYAHCAPATLSASCSTCSAPHGVASALHVCPFW